MDHMGFGKILALGLAGALMLGCLAGCGDSGVSDPDGGKAAVTEDSGKNAGKSDGGKKDGDGGNHGDAGGTKASKGSPDELERTSPAWAKSHWDNGTMYIYTDGTVPCRLVMAGGDAVGMDAMWGRDKDGFFLSVSDEEKGAYYNAGPDALGFTGDVVLVKEDGSEYRQAIKASMQPGSDLVGIEDWCTNYVISAVSHTGAPSARVELTSDYDDVLVVPVPDGEAYNEIIPVAINFLWFPTHDDVLYTGDEAYPGLVSWLEGFEKLVDAEIEGRKLQGTELSIAMDLMGMNTDVREAYDMYLEMREHLGREVDGKAYYEVANRIDAKIGLRTFQEEGDLITDGVGLLDRLFG